MKNIFIIEDEFHAELIGKEHNSYEEAFIEIKRISKIPWNQFPNICPCFNENCGRDYVIIQYDATSIPWREINKKYVLKVSKLETVWQIKE